MKVTFTPDPNGLPLYLVDLEVGDQLLDELKQENWVSITPTHNDDAYTKRNRIDGAIKGKQVIEVSQFMRSPEFKKLVLDTVWKNKMFQHKWGPRLNYKKLNKATITEFGFNKDQPGWCTDLHLENRCQIAYGMMYFIPQDSEERSTYFYSTKNRDNPWRFPTGMGKGWLLINTDEGWHEGWNRGTEEKYTASFNFTFDIFHEGRVKADDATIKYIRGESDQI